jgi:hypothetical protein
MVDMVIKTGTQMQIELMWGILKEAQEELDVIVPLEKKERIIDRDEMQ